MSQCVLLTAGIAAIAASFLIGAGVMVTRPAGTPLMGWSASSNGQSISIDKARQSVQSFLDRTGDRDLKIDELMEFQQNFYALIKEQSTGTGAFELLVNKGNGRCRVRARTGHDVEYQVRDDGPRGNDGWISVGVLKCGHDGKH